MLANGQPVRDAERLVERADGSRVTLSINIDPLRGASGELIGAVNCFRDITERKRMDAALETLALLALEQEQRLAATYEHAAIGISEVAPDGRFLRVNEAICAITGFAATSCCGHQLFGNPIPTMPTRTAKRFASRSPANSISIRWRSASSASDGRVIWISVRSSPVRDGDGQLLYVVRVVQDITERKEAEQRQQLLIDELNHRVKNTLATRAVARLADRARGADAGGLSRELRGPADRAVQGARSAHRCITGKAPTCARC